MKLKEIQIQLLLKLNVDGAREFAGKSLYSNTTLVKVKYISSIITPFLASIQIQLLLKLNYTLTLKFLYAKYIQIQLLLKLNLTINAIAIPNDKFKYNSC